MITEDELKLLRKLVLSRVKMATIYIPALVKLRERGLVSVEDRVFWRLTDAGVAEIVAIDGDLTPEEKAAWISPYPPRYINSAGKPCSAHAYRGLIEVSIPAARLLMRRERNRRHLHRIHTA